MKNNFTNLSTSTLVTLILLAIVISCKAQGPGSGVNDPTLATFIDMRNTDFTKLVGQQEGGKINYSAEKANAEGSGGFSLTQDIIMQIGGSIGTTGNLLELFNEDIQPTYTSSLTLHFVLPGTTYFYDGTLGGNIANLQNPAVPVTAITPLNLAGNPLEYTYTQAFKNKILAGTYTYNAAIPLYTCKRFFWASIAGLYNNSKYQFYDKKKQFANQLFEEHYSAGNVKGSLNFYISWNKSEISWNTWRPEFFFATVGVKYGLENNILQLKKTTITDISYTEVDTTGSVRQVTKANSAYQGIFQQYTTIVPSAEIIISPVKAFALDVFADYNLLNKSDRDKFNTDNYLSLAAGVYYYGSEKTSKINIGLFYRWTMNSSKKLKEEIGIKVSLPITPIF